MVRSANLGYPRIGAHRELKRAVEGYWNGDLAQDELRASARALRHANWTAQSESGLDFIPSNDFSYYDQVLDTCAMVGAVPPRFPWDGETVDLDTYFAMARGVQEREVDAPQQGDGAKAMEMTKWFDTNYHYIVPELSPNTTFSLTSRRPVEAYEEALEHGVETRPVLLDPVTFLMLGKTTSAALDALDLLDGLVPVYEQVLQELEEAGCTAVQMDAPALVLDLTKKQRAAFESAYETLSAAADVDLHLTTYFGSLGPNLDLAASLPVDLLHVDLAAGDDDPAEVASALSGDTALSLGLVDGRNVWRADLPELYAHVDAAVDALGADRVVVAPSCSLLHVPVDLDAESDLDAEVRPWLAFARQKLAEIDALARRARGDDVSDLFDESRAAREARARSHRVNDEDVQARVVNVDDSMTRRNSPHAERRDLQHERMDLPTLPTTTIGSFPQTDDVRQMRKRLKRGEIDREAYEAFLEETIDDTIAAQEEIGLDVLVHGEPERSDMVEYFAQQLDGFVFTDNGWVQSYGTRCVRPPVIVGDVSRPEPMTVRWLAYAQDQTDQPVKGMLTGPVTLLQWSFERDDQPRADTCRQLALAIRDEVADLEAAGIPAIQIDEPAFREGLPLRESDWDDYLDWAVECFRLASSGVQDETQIHTHMCYSEFNDVIDAIAEMDADVISIEATRSKMDLLDAFAEFDYPNEIGPGVYDIHSPRVPEPGEMESLISSALDVLDPDQMWVNPDCGLKTRRWVEVRPALENMVEAAQHARQRVG
jgi:5-methyltetrahydropteroyltriglutamate--homocysteine methyltransferase